MNKHNKSAAGLNVFFLFLFVYSSHCIFHHLFALSLLSYPASANPPPLTIHKASSYLFTRFLTAFLLLFFSARFLRQRRISGLENSSEFHLTGGRHMEAPPPFCPQEGSGGTGLSFCVFPLFCSRPSFHPALLLSFCPCLLSREEGGRQVPACISTPD